MGDSVSMGQIAGHLQTVCILETCSFVVLLAFLAALGLKLWGAYKDFQGLMTRRIRPLISQSKALVKTSKDLGLSVAERGKGIFDIGMQTVESVEMRAQTTARVVKGAIPEARRLPEEVNATTQDVKEAVKTAHTVAQAYRAVQSVKSMIRAAENVSAVVRATRHAAASGPPTAVDEVAVASVDSSTVVASASASGSDRGVLNPESVGGSTVVVTGDRTSAVPEVAAR